MLIVVMFVRTSAGFFAVNNEQDFAGQVRCAPLLLSAAIREKNRLSADNGASAMFFLPIAICSVFIVKTMRSAEIQEMFLRGK